MLYLGIEEMKGWSKMAVEYESIIQKMITELQHAKAVQNNHTKMKRHIAKVQALSELILDEASKIETEAKVNITDQEIKAMLGKEKVNNQQLNKSLGADQEDDGSIFDF